MATRDIIVNILDENLILKIELEKSVLLKSLKYQLELENHLQSSTKYYTKNRSGELLDENLSAQEFPPNIFITTDPEWNQIFTSTIKENEVIKINDEIILHENTYWFIPLISKSLWANDSKRFHIFNIGGIRLINGDDLEINVIIQYKELNDVLFREQVFEEFVRKVSQIIGATIRIELSENSLSSKDFFNDLNNLRKKIIEYVNAHIELKWNARIEHLSIFNFSHFPNN